MPRVTFPTKLTAESKITLILGLIGLLLLLMGTSDNPTILGRYSIRYLAVLAGYAVLMGAAVVVLSWEMPTLPAFVWLAGAGLAFLIVNILRLLDHTWWLHAVIQITLNWLIIALLLRADVQLRLFRPALIAVGGLFLAINLLSLQAYPRMQTIDEGWDANVGWTFIHEGILYTRLNQGILGKPELFVPVANILPAYWLQVVGVGFLQARLFIFFGSMVMLALTYAVALRLYRRVDVALVALLLLAGSFAFVTRGHVFRLDLYVGLAGILALYLFLRAEQRPWLTFVSGAILALSTEFHQNGLLLCVAAGIALTLQIARRSLREKRLSIRRADIYFMLGGIMGVIPFVVLHILPDPSEFTRQFSSAVDVRETAAQSAAPRGSLESILNAAQSYLESAPVEFAALLVLCLCAVWQPIARRLAILLLIVVAVYTLVFPSLNSYYWINFFPLIPLVAAGVLYHWIVQRRAVVLALCLLVAVPTLMLCIGATIQGTNTQLLSIAKEVAATVKPGERIVAMPYYFFAMPDQPYLMSPFMPEYAAIGHFKEQGIDVWRTLKPDVFIVSPVALEPITSHAEQYRQEQGFAETARYTQAGCCVYVYRRP
jgi:hypothetical protein